MAQSEEFYRNKIQQEIAVARDSVKTGNDGRVRVRGRRVAAGQFSGLSLAMNAPIGEPMQ